MSAASSTPGVPRHRRLLHALAVITAATALLPIVVGALVTTLDAGMAFADWPSSDGHGMLAYPWLKSAGDKFLEHGHRLAGITVGCVSILFAAAVWFLESRRWVRWCGPIVLLAVVAQGLLGGQRVLADARLLAMLHGLLAAGVFCLMSAVALFLSRSWSEPPAAERNRTQSLGRLRLAASITIVAVLVQYTLGGMLRHLGTALYEHMGMAALVLVSVAATVACAVSTGNAWLKRAAYVLAAFAVVQASLGGLTWITKFGFATFGYVAVERSLLQTVSRTSHTVVGMFLLMTSVMLLLKTLRVVSLCRVPVAPRERTAPLLSLMKGSA